MKVVCRKVVKSIMKKKIVLFILLFLFCITGVKAAPSESDNYAIGETGYPTFNDALAAAGSTQTTITLLKDLGDNITIPEGKNIILDLGNHTLRNTSANATVIVNNGTLVITNGTVTSDKKSGMINNNSSGKLTIKPPNCLIPFIISLMFSTSAFLVSSAFLAFC